MGVVSIRRPVTGRPLAPLIAALLAAAATLPARADPLPTRNENPLLAPYGIKEVVRTGKIAMARGAHTAV